MSQRRRKLRRLQLNSYSRSRGNQYSRMASASTVDHSVGYLSEIFGSEDVDEKFRCNICRKILREPVQAICGHRFCRICIVGEFNKSGKDQIECMRCQQEESSTSFIKQDEIFPDNAVKRELFKKKVKCSNPGCHWNGTFKDFEEHFKDCEFKLVACEYCGQPINKETRESHLSSECKVKCPACGADVPTIHKEHHLQTECPKTPVACPTCGQQGIIRENLQHHKDQECLGDKVRCPPCTAYGEPDLVDRNAYQDHFNAKGHSKYVMEKLVQTDQIVHQLSQTLERLPLEVKEQFTIVDRKCHEYEESITQLGAALQQIGTGGAGIVGINDANIDQKIRQQLELQMNLINDRVDTKTGTFEGIANTLHRELDKAITAIEKLDRHRRELKEQNDINVAKLKSMERSLVAKDTMIADLEVKVRDLEGACFDGDFIWKVPEFTQKHQDAIAGRSISMYSSPFYTSRRGYKMCARLYPNGDGMGKGSHLSLFFVVMRGDFDALLPWPFKQRVTFCLINQNGGEHVADSFRPDPNSSSFKRPTSNMNIASGCPLFLRLDILQNTTNGFLRDDTMFLKISVDLAELNEPMSQPDERVKVAE